MKKIILSLAVTATFCGTCAAAYENGDITGLIRYSGIDTYINNYPINAYNIDGYQLICAEDLSGYGFIIDWNSQDRSLSVNVDYSVTEIPEKNDVLKKYYMVNRRAYNAVYSDIAVYLNQERVDAYSIDGKMMIKLRELERFGSVEYSEENNCSMAIIDGLPVGEYKPLEIDYDTKPVVVIDPGHGKSSYLMSEEEKINEGYVYNSGRWGEWRHFKSGESNIECGGDGCNHYGNCWYGIENGDRDNEPDINLRNALNAKKYLEQMGYTVRMTRMSNEENPSFGKRISYCYPDNDMNNKPDASCYVCIHANAGGGRGTAYIQAEGYYDQKWIDKGYANNSNELGMYINDRIDIETSLSKHGDGSIDGLGYMILFNKCPVPAGYMEIGFYDSSDINILKSESDKIGLAIANGVQDYMYK